MYLFILGAFFISLCNSGKVDRDLSTTREKVKVETIPVPGGTSFTVTMRLFEEWREDSQPRGGHYSFPNDNVHDSFRREDSETSTNLPTGVRLREGREVSPFQTDMGDGRYRLLNVRTYEKKKKSSFFTDTWVDLRTKLFRFCITSD